jgi:hypothetical protein
MDRNDIYDIVQRYDKDHAIHSLPTLTSSNSTHLSAHHQSPYSGTPITSLDSSDGWLLVTPTPSQGSVEGSLVDWSLLEESLLPLGRRLVVFSALRDVLAHYSTVHIVVDALDECQDSDGARRQFLAKLSDLQTGRDIRLMATSRVIPEIVDAFNEALKLEVQASKEDVKRFVAGQICRLPKCIQRDPALQKIVQEKIVEAVDGMYALLG